MISAAQLKGTKGPVGRPWKFQSETGTPCVCVNWSQAHYLACSRLNLPSESTPFVDYCTHLLEGEKKNCYSLIIPSRCWSRPIFCSLLSFGFLVEVVYLERVSLHRVEFKGPFFFFFCKMELRENKAKAGMRHTAVTICMHFEMNEKKIFGHQRDDVMGPME